MMNDINNTAGISYTGYFGNNDGEIHIKTHDVSMIINTNGDTQRNINNLEVKTNKEIKMLKERIDCFEKKYDFVMDKIFNIEICLLYYVLYSADDYGNNCKISTPYNLNGIFLSDSVNNINVVNYLKTQREYTFPINSTLLKIKTNFFDEDLSNIEIDFNKLKLFYNLETLFISLFNIKNLANIKNDNVKRLYLEYPNIHESTNNFLTINRETHERCYIDFSSIDGIQNMPNLETLHLKNLPLLENIHVILSSYSHKIKEIIVDNCKLLSKKSSEIIEYCNNNNIKITFYDKCFDSRVYKNIGEENIV